MQLQQVAIAIEEKYMVSERVNPKPCPVVHFEIGCQNLKKTTDFYAKLFDWNIKPADYTNDIVAVKDGISGHIAAIGEKPDHYVTIYISVDKIEDYLERVVALGGKAIVGPIVIPEGRFAWFMDPEGNQIGLLDQKQS